MGFRGHLLESIIYGLFLSDADWEDVVLSQSLKHKKQIPALFVSDATSIGFKPYLHLY